MTKWIAALGLVLFSTSFTLACDKCKLTQSHSSVPLMQVTSTPVSVPMAVSAPMAVYQVPQTAVLSGVQTSPVQVMSVAATPTYYSTNSLQSVPLSPTIGAQSVVASNGLYYTTTPQTLSAGDAQAQGLVSDLIFGLARPTACEFCRSIGCSNGNGGSAGDPVRSLKESIKEIGDVIKAVKNLEKDLKDAVNSDESDDSASPSSHDEQVAKLTEIRDELRRLQKSGK